MGSMFSGVRGLRLWTNIQEFGKTTGEPLITWVLGILLSCPVPSQPVHANLWDGALFHAGLGMARRKEDLDPIASVVFFGSKEGF